MPKMGVPTPPVPGPTFGQTQALLDDLLDVQKSSKGLLDGPEIKHSIYLIVRPMKLTLSLTTTTQAVLCI